MKIINLTPHDVNICDVYGNVTKTYEASGTVARLSNTWTTVTYIDDIPIVVMENETLIDLPEPQDDVYYIVSAIVQKHCSDRADLISPAQQVRVDGRVVGCRSFRW